jgi:hypothetical protein
MCIHSEIVALTPCPSLPAAGDFRVPGTAPAGELERERYPLFCDFRDKDAAGADIVLERGLGRIAGVEVKSGATVRRGDFSGLLRRQKAVGERFASGVVP